MIIITFWGGACRLLSLSSEKIHNQPKNQNLNNRAIHESKRVMRFSSVLIHSFRLIAFDSGQIWWWFEKLRKIGTSYHSFQFRNRNEQELCSLIII